MVSQLSSYNKINLILDNYYISIKLKAILSENNLEKFLEWYLYLLNIKQIYNGFNPIEYFSNIKFLIENEFFSNSFVKANSIILQILKERKQIQSENKSEILEKLFDLTENVSIHNKIRQVVFVTPELGRWSTVGGLGVMVDELSQGLVSEGRDVVMITPYYNKNRKGETDYLKNDPCNFKYIGNITVQLDDSYTFGIHYGECNGVKIYFLHNYIIFPEPYPDASADFTTKQIACFSKASLEVLCYESLKPDIILTNDWFTGLVPAYNKYGHFGDYFKDSKFFHICHNLEPAYEGRLYPSHGVS